VSGEVPRITRLVCVSVNAAIDKTAAVPRLIPGEIHRPEMLSVLPGGKALNVARAARTLGLDASVIAVLGGHAGDWMEEQLAARAIRTRAVRVPGETRTCLSILDSARGGLTEFYEAGLELSAAGWAAVETALRAELSVDPREALVVVAGSLPPGAPVDG
jgi:tagatose 6-phosphate kinase